MRRADLTPRECASLRATFSRFLGYAQPADADRVAHAVKRLRAFLAGCGASPAYVDQAARRCVDDALSAGGRDG